MTPDEMDKKIEFILQMQAQFEANMSLAKTNTHDLRVSVSDLKASVATLAGLVRNSIKLSDDRLTRFDQRMLEVAEVQKATDERLRALADAQKSTDKSLKALADAQKSTEDRLNALISVTERHITGPDHLSRP